MENHRSFVDDYEAMSDKERIKALEARLAYLEGHGGTSSTITIDPASRTEFTDESDESGRQVTQLTNADTIPRVRKCNFIEFKNRFCEEDGHYAVDVLVSGAFLDQEIREEQRLREKLSEQGNRKSRIAKNKAHAYTKKATNLSNTNHSRNAESRENWIQRIRLQSPAVLKILANTQGETWPARPRTYFRPFSTLIYFQPRMRKALDELEGKWASYLDGASPATTVERPRNTVLGEEDPVDDCPAALAAMRCYVQFFDEEIMPEYTQYDNLDHASGAKVRFSDLWYLFRTGEIINRQLEGDQLGLRRDYSMGERKWRIYGIRPGDTQYKVTPSDHRKYEKDQDQIDDTSENASFVIWAYYIEYTGEEFCVVTNTFFIPPFNNDRSVTSLPVFPRRFLADWDISMEASIRNGDKVMQYVDTKHGSYNAWTVMRTPKGDPITDANGATLQHAEHINSEIMVDFAEAFQVCPTWKPTRSVLRRKTVSQIIDSDEFVILYWSDHDRTKLLGEVSEITPVRTAASMLEHNKYVSENTFLSKLRENDSRGLLTTKDQIPREDKALIAGRVFAYVFRERKFSQLNIEKVMPSSGTRDALEALKIPQRIKDTIQNSIRGHFRQKDAEKKLPEAMQSLDLIQGKGDGLFILLHGVPGVGKTATAEAVAQANGKPLFKITCGDLGLTPDKVESSLRGIFRLAGLWDCILLLDEVDTFFSQRSKGDAAMTKNALVSVFLRILDYYNGVLFLTTNRAGALDEAFKSRIHCKIYYPPLTRDQTIEIWENNIQRLRTIEEKQCIKEMRRPLEIQEDEILHFAATQFDNNRRDTGQWNGRQIRNAFQVARSLAYAEAADEADKIKRRGSHEQSVPRLDVKHFELLDEITDQFDQYMEEVHGGMNDADLAREMEHRADHYEQPHDHGYSHGRPTPSIDTGRSRSFTGRHTSIRNSNTGTTLAIPGMSHRYQSRGTSSLTAGFDESSGDGLIPNFRPHSPNSVPPRHSPFQQHTSPTITFNGPSPGEGDYRLQDSPSETRYASGVGLSESSPPNRGSGDYTRGRESSQRHSHSENDQFYAEERNRYGKRERLMEDRNPYG